MTVAKGIETPIDQAQMWQVAFAHPLNGVIVVKTNLTTQAKAHLVTFKSDLTLADDTLMDDGMFQKTVDTLKTKKCQLIFQQI